MTDFPHSHLDFERRFGGLARLYGAAGLQRIARAHVAVVGVGGVGSWAAEALARSGVGRITLIDLDHVAESNINRQIHAADATLGAAKVSAMRERIASFHPACIVDEVDDFVDAQNWPALLEKLPQFNGLDAIIDACDDARAKRTLATWALQNAPHSSSHTTFVTVGAAGGKRRAQAVEIDDIARVTHDPLLARLRADLRRHAAAPRGGAKMGITCVFSREEVKKPTQNQSLDAEGAVCDNSLNCHGYGSVVTVTATFGLVAAGWALEQIAAQTQKF